jgi:hypothetical protein
MSSFGVTSSGHHGRNSVAENARLEHSQAWRESFAAVIVVLVGIGAFAFVLIVLPWVISIN